MQNNGYHHHCYLSIINAAYNQIVLYLYNKYKGHLLRNYNINIAIYLLDKCFVNIDIITACKVVSETFDIFIFRTECSAPTGKMYVVLMLFTILCQ